MRWILLLTVFAFAGTAQAATPPEGFRYSYPLSKRVVAISGQPTARVYCARSDQEWMLYMEIRLVPMTAYGATDMTTNETYLAPWVCRPMERRLRGNHVPLANLGEAIVTLVHEAMHVQGVASERVAQCRALKLLPSVARTHFRVTALASLRTIQNAARNLAPC